MLVRSGSPKDDAEGLRERAAELDALLEARTAEKAYALGDAEQLHVILQAWERSPDSVTGSDPNPIRLQLIRRLSQIDEQVAVIAGDLEVLTDAPLVKLKTLVDEAAAGGKDLVREMIGRLKRSIVMREGCRYKKKGGLKAALSISEC